MKKIIFLWLFNSSVIVAMHSPLVRRVFQIPYLCHPTPDAQILYEDYQKTLERIKLIGDNKIAKRYSSKVEGIFSKCLNLPAHITHEETLQHVTVLLHHDHNPYKTKRTIKEILEDRTNCSIKKNVSVEEVDSELIKKTAKELKKALHAINCIVLMDLFKNIAVNKKNQSTQCHEAAQTFNFCLRAPFNTSDKSALLSELAEVNVTYKFKKNEGLIDNAITTLRQLKKQILKNQK